MKTNHHLGLLILRLTIGVLMLLHGIAKLKHGVSGIENMLAGKGLPEFLAYGVFIGELVAPALIIVGYRTKLAALVFVMNMVVIILLAHTNELFELNKHGAWAIELVGLYLFGAITLLFTGGGKIAVSSSKKWD